MRRPTLSRLIVLVALAAAAAFSAACADSKKAVTDSPNPKLATAVFHIGAASVTAEIARSETERERGLMFRTALADGAGMLFVFDKDEQLSFWMKNTLVPLSIAFIATDGTIRQIADMQPQSLATTLADRSCRYALEVPQGWFGRAGVKVGDRIDLSPLAQ